MQYMKLLWISSLFDAEAIKSWATNSVDNIGKWDVLYIQYSVLYSHITVLPLNIW